MEQISADRERAFFLGAGTSLHSSIPLTKQFIPYLFSNRFENQTRLEELRTFLRQLFPQVQVFEGNAGRDQEEREAVYLPKFEQVLSMLDLALIEDTYISSEYNLARIRRLRQDMDYLIWKLLQEGSIREENPVFASFVQNLNPRDLLISLNYDTLLDHALLQGFQGVDYGLRFSEIHHDGSYDGPQGPLYLKLHGSLNWLYCPNCQAFYSYLGPKSLQRVFERKPELCPYDQSYLRGTLVSPTWNKRYNLPPLSLVWMKASKALRTVKKLTFIGYSLSDVDMKVLFLLKRSLFNNSNNPLIEVVDPEPTGKIKARYERLFSNVVYREESFEDYVDYLNNNRS